MTKEPTVLIIDDEITNVKILDAIFRKDGFSTITARDGSDGRRIAQTENPDLILLDVMMPGEDGFETCTKLKVDPVTADIPVIFLSALDTTEDKVKGLTIGAIDYITKPFNKAEVLARARTHIKLRNAYSALIEEQSSKLRQLYDAQQSILAQPSDMPEANFAVYYQPANEAGGDFYDVIKISKGIFGYFMADISGHDIGSSYITAALKALINQNSGPLFTPRETVKMINGVMHTILKDGLHLTACYAHLNHLRHRLTVVSAGHPPIVYISKDGQAKHIHAPGDVIGIFDSIYLEEIETEVAAGDRFFLYTDGLLDSGTGNVVSRSDCICALSEICSSTINNSLPDAISKIIGSLHPVSALLQDDIVLLGVDI